MRIQSTTISLILAVGITSFALAGCSDDDDSVGSGLAKQVIDTVADAVADNLAEAAITPESPQPVAAEPEVIPAAAPQPEVAMMEAADMVLVGQLLYTVFDGGVVIYDFASKDRTVIAVEEKLQAIAVQEGIVYVGGDYLYTVGESSLQRLEYEFEGVINCLEVHGAALMIGTETGLYSKSLFGREQVVEDIPVTAMATAEGSLWVGTDGEGLYNWDGDTFRKRFLLRDEHMFDTVHALDFQHNHLYVGTSNGFHIYNGGVWQNLDTSDGLPADDVTAINAEDWVVYLGTEEGVVSWFGGQIDPIEEFEGRDVNAIQIRGRNLIAATDREGVIAKSGRMVRTLVDPELEGGTEVVALSE